MKIFLDTVGCRLNQSEIETYARQFRVAGHTLVPTPQSADMVVVNTCAVTAAAASDSRQKVRQAARAGAKEIVVTGCWSSLNPSGAASLPGVSRVIPNLEKDNLVSTLLYTQESFYLEPVAREPIPGARLRTRAFIKVQDGCDNHCTFCITTVARGPGRSRSIAEVLADIRAALSNSSSELLNAAKEIVLTGVHLGSWGRDFSPRLHLRDLVKGILRETDVPRLRLSSLEPWDLDGTFFSLWEDQRLCRHVHLPLQSGCRATLRRMARKTTPESFAALVAAARAAIPDVAITTDIIVGFPGETQAEFDESLAFVKEMGFSGGHVFTYSARPGTAAASMPNQVSKRVSKERSGRMRAFFFELSQAYQLRFLGRTMPVLWENTTSMGPDTWQMSGLTDNYLRVNADAPRHLWNQLTPVHLTGLDNGELVGAIST
ncbi:MAG TPA: MiaB/RimO family radical SAM methylthiotransferase [Anaerolineales bacterium]|nr:MiaB/RimO family radical SAM methylthiotransferase [Anaerolineales bacterium]